MSLKPATIGAIGDVVRVASTNPIPDILPFHEGLLTRMSQDFEVIRQADIAAMIGNFQAACAVLMPSRTVDAYVADRCESYDLPFEGTIHKRLLVVPGWSEMQDIRIPRGATASERADSLAKFSHEEVLAIVQAMGKCPDIMVALGVFQGLVSEYLHTVSLQAKDVGQQLQSRMHTLKEHWLRAGNFQKMLHAALVHVRPQDVAIEQYFEQMDQSHIGAAFTFLTESRAFDMALPADITPVGMSLLFSCPARQILRQLFLEQETFLRVVRALRSSQKQAHCNRAAQQCALRRCAMRSVVQSNADIIGTVISPGANEDYDRLEQFDAMLQQYGL